jgi:endonuclease G
MMSKKRSQRTKKGKDPIRKLWGYCKLLVFLTAIGCVGYGFWYSQQDEATQSNSQEQILVVLDWLIERDETKKETDEILRWIVQQIPASQGIVVSVGNIEGADYYTFAGVPVGSRPVKVLKNRGYLVGYDEARQNPAWVAYRLEYAADASTVERPNGFKTDSRTRARVDHHDYTNTGYDRGHMAPNYAIGRAYGAKAQVETFLMSNIVPQLPDLNRGPWRALEQRIANAYLDDSRELWVITGPIYDETSLQLSAGVAVPFSFFKIVVDVVNSGKVRLLAFVMPQQIKDDDLKAYLTSVDMIEAETGLDFFSLLDDLAESQLESRRAGRVW